MTGPVQKRAAKYGEARDFLNVAALWTGEACVDWPFGMGDVGYGRVTWGGRQQSASTVVCEMRRGPRPSRLHVAAHSCGNHLCVNGGHLSWKTYAENSLDMVRHGRSRRGQPQPPNRLTEEQVRIVRRSEEAARDLAARFGVPRHTIWNVRARRTYISVP